eukprot:scaffold161284_cov17-Tisochrysis_lutea.AAC.1
MSTEAGHMLPPGFTNLRATRSSAAKEKRLQSNPNRAKASAARSEAVLRHKYIAFQFPCRSVLPTNAGRLVRAQVQIKHVPTAEPMVREAFHDDTGIELRACIHTHTPPLLSRHCFCPRTLLLSRPRWGGQPGGA